MARELTGDWPVPAAGGASRTGSRSNDLLAPRTTREHQARRACAGYSIIKQNKAVDGPAGPGNFRAVSAAPGAALTFSLRGAETGGEAGCWSVPLEAIVRQGRFHRPCRNEDTCICPSPKR